MSVVDGTKNGTEEQVKGDEITDETENTGESSTDNKPVAVDLHVPVYHNEAVVIDGDVDQNDKEQDLVVIEQS